MAYTDAHADGFSTDNPVTRGVQVLIPLASSVGSDVDDGTLVITTDDGPSEITLLT